MFCSQCANEVEAHAKFCSRCGYSLVPVQKTHHDMNMHVTVLAWIYIAGSILMGIAGIIALFASQLISRLPIPWPPEVPPEVIPLIGSIVVFAGLINLALAGGVAAAGIGLLQYTNWGRICAVIMGAMLAFWFPVGTATGLFL